ncbi:hypothetical protein HanHA300_Chr11g0383701 [Helianthus annuus]|nr:hypothetical protein HanHA300_Chr11g0383701 [Helianthus annuus]
MKKLNVGCLHFLNHCTNSCVVLVYATMSRVAKWKIEKAKVKVVFRLQFHATNL